MKALFWRHTRRFVCGMMMGLVAATSGLGQHEHHGADAPAVEKPRVFLDKSPRVVAYQLKRLNNERLLLVDRNTDSPKYGPVYQAILLRAGMSPQYRQEAIDGLVTINQSSAAREVISAIATLDPADRQQARTASELATLLLKTDPDALQATVDIFAEATGSENALARRTGFAGLVAAGEVATAFSLAREVSATTDLIHAVAILPRPEIRNQMRDQLLGFLDDEHPEPLRRAAITALQHLTKDQRDTFQRLASFVRQPAYRTAAVGTLLKIPHDQRDQATSIDLLESLVHLAEQTPAEARTTDAFLEAMQFADQLLSRVPPELARSQRQRLRDVTVRVVMIHTVEEEMRYDVAYFAVEAGRPVQVVLRNEDLMPHNLVVVSPGSLQEVAELGLAVGPQGFQGKDYVPDHEHVLHATHMIAPGKQERLTFTAPTEPGEYPYVCTFPRHWMRMYGVMVVVEDLDAWLADPVPPQDPIGSNRPFVKSWTLEDLQDEVDQGVRGRSLEIGQRIFQEATCAQCHKAGGIGGAVGPELSEVFERWKGNRVAVLHEILDPSHRIDAKYAVHLVVTTEGNTFSGIVAKEDSKSVSLVTNPESNEFTVIPRDEIDEMVRTSTSMMPKGLLDRFTKDEIFELMAYLESLRP